MNRPTLLIPLLAACAAASAQTPGVTFTPVTTYLFDRNNTFGWRFTPTRDIDVKALGYFDASGGTGLVQSHDVGIFRVSDQALLASTTVPAGTAAPLIANFRYSTLATPLHLFANTAYLIGATARSASPDPAPGTNFWSFPPEVIYANLPTPTLAAPNSGTSFYLVSGTGNPPSTLTYPPLAEMGLLPSFIANFLFTSCYPNCDASTVIPILNANDFQCFLNSFAASDPYANCDGSTTPPVLNANDFQCFLNAFAAGCQ